MEEVPWNAKHGRSAGGIEHGMMSKLGWSALTMAISEKIWEGLGSVDVSDAGYNFNFLLLASIGGVRLSTINVRAKAEEVSSKPRKVKTRSKQSWAKRTIWFSRWHPSLDGSHSFFFTMIPASNAKRKYKNALGILFSH
jgi:hypothetical protein